MDTQEVEEPDETETVNALAASPFEVIRRDCEEYARLEQELIYAEANATLIPTVDNTVIEMVTRVAFNRVRMRCAAHGVGSSY